MSRPQDSHTSPSPQDHSPTDPSADAPARASRTATPHLPASSPSPHPNSSEGYPSWLPKRPPPPAPTSTFQSSTTNMLATAAEAGPSAPSPVWGGRKPTPRSVRIISMREAATQREPTEQTRVSSAAPLHSRVWSRATGGMSPTLVSQILDGRLRLSRPKFRSPGLHLELLRNPSWKSRLHFYIFPLLVLAHIPLQTFFDFNAAFILIEIAKFPNPVAPGVPGSGQNWALGAVAYIACWTVWILGVFIGYELIYSFYRRWRYRRPQILPLYLSSPAFNFVSMTSYANFCFMQHVRNSAFPSVDSKAVLPSAEGSLRDALAETCYFYSQNLPTVALLLPRAGLALAVLLTFYSPKQLPGGLTLGDVDPNIGRRDGTFFNQTDGTLSGYAKGVLIANAAWAAWRTLVLLFSWLGLWIFSGYGCAGICGPRTRWEEEEAERTLSVYSEKDADAVETLPWSWKECTHVRVQEAYDFCLTLKRPQSGLKKEVSEPATPVAFQGVEQVLAAVGLGGGVPTAARRGMLSQELFDTPKEGNSRKGSPVEEEPDTAQYATRPDPKDAPITTLPYPFTGFGVKREEPSQEQIPFPPSPGLPGEEDEESPEGEEEYEEEEAEPRTSEDPSSFSGRQSNSMSSLGQPIPSRYPFQFRHPGRGGSLSSTGSPGFSARSHRTPQSKSTSSHTHTHSTGGSRVSRSTGNAESSDSPMSFAGSSGAPSPVGMSMPMPPRHPSSSNGVAGRRQRSGTVPTPSSPSPAVGGPIGFPYGRPRTRTRTSESVGTDLEPSVLYESEFEDGPVGPLDLSGEEAQSHAGGPSPEPEGSQEALEREDSVGLLSPQPSPKTSSSGLRAHSGSSGSVNRFNRSRSRHTSAGSGSRSGSNSRHNSHHSVSSVSVAGIGARGIRSRAQSLIHSVGSASRSSIEIVLSSGRARAQSAVRLEDYDEGAESSLYFSEGGLSSPENYTFGQPVSGGAGMGWRAVRGQRRPTQSSSEGPSDHRETDIEEASVESEPREPAVGSGSGSPHHLRAVASNISGHAPSTVSQAAPSERTVSAEPSPSPPHMRATSPSVPIPMPRSPTSASGTGTQFLSVAEQRSDADISTAAGSFITAPATIAGKTDSSGRTPSSWGGMDDYMQGKDLKPI
ncbi:hypothetical protein OF83DRAFT_631016 [Amylostereum chailletii]|nr:hypothetical protein OF83DRAFT_631016 [Amylostereum chailletii]